MAQRTQLALVGEPTIIPDVVATEPQLPDLREYREDPERRRSRDLLFQVSEAVAIAALVKHYGWTHLGEDTLRRYRTFVPAPARVEAQDVAA